MRAVALAFATSLGVGYLPFAPGTFGSLAGLVLWWFLPSSAAVQAAAIIALFVIGSWSATVAEQAFAKTDPGQVVIDEVMGMLITLFMFPVGSFAAVAGFFLFRLFDIVKPYPANRFEHLYRGVGVMADDAMAAVYANLALHVVMIVARAALGSGVA